MSDEINKQALLAWLEEQARATAQLEDRYYNEGEFAVAARMDVKRRAFETVVKAVRSGTFDD